ncbi:MAG: sugar ABC transporter substrate-binding protein, partial [Stutzerimonas stutzeri]
MRWRPLPLAFAVLVIAVAIASLVGVRLGRMDTTVAVAAAPSPGAPRYGLSTVGLSYPFAAAIAKGFSDAAAKAG